MDWRHLSISRLIAVCVPRLSRVVSRAACAIVSQLRVAVNKLRLVFPSKLVNHSTHHLDNKNASLGIVAWRLIILIQLL